MTYLIFPFQDLISKLLLKLYIILLQKISSVWSIISNCMATQNNKTQSISAFNVNDLCSSSLFIIIITFLTVIFTLNAVFIQPLFQMGVNAIHDMQVGFQSKVFEVFMNIFSLICNTPIIAVIFLLQMGLAKHKFKAIIHLSFFLVGFHVIAILKQAYQQSRPIWVSAQINKYEWFCPTDFGNPSGHSYVSFPLFEPIIAKYIRFQRVKLSWLFVLFFAIAVPFSRMYLGVHSLNQVFFGLSFGLAWTVLYRYGLRRMFYKVYSLMLKLKNVFDLCLVILVHIVLVIIPIIIFKIRLDNTPLSQFDLANLNKICNSAVTSGSIQGSMLALCILQSPIFGIMYGLFALKSTKEQKLYFSGQWKYSSNISAFWHCLAQLLCAGVVPGIVIGGIGRIWEQPYSRFFGYNVSLIIGGFFYIWLTPKFERKYEWIKFDVEQYIISEAGIKFDKLDDLKKYNIDTIQSNKDFAIELKLSKEKC